MKNLATYEFRGKLSHRDSKKHLLHSFKVPRGANTLKIALRYEQHIVGTSRNLITLCVFDPEIYRGAGHRQGPALDISISLYSATPGFLSGPIPHGSWKVELDTHWINPDAPCLFQLEVEVSQVDLFNPKLSDNSSYKRPSPPSRAGWYWGDLHTHSVHSDGVYDVSTLLQSAREKGLDFIALTDHNTVSGLEEVRKFAEKQPLCIEGMEFTTFWGHALGLGIHQWVDWRTGLSDRSMSQVLDEVTASSGLFVIAHPVAAHDSECTGCSWRYNDIMPGAAHAVEIWNEKWDNNNDRSLHLWYQWLNLGYRISATAGSDQHDAKYRRDNLPGIGFNVVNVPFLTERQVIEAIRQGQIYLSSYPQLTISGRCKELDFVPMGGQLLGENKIIEISWHQCPNGASFRIILDGEIADLWPATTWGRRTWTIPDSKFKWCLVELRDASGIMVAITNQIYLNIQ